MVLGVLLLLFGYVMYAGVAPQWQQYQTWLGQLAVSFSPQARGQYQELWLRYYGSIAAMGVGGLLILQAFLGGSAS